jgi:hypothetical protein
MTHARSFACDAIDFDAIESERASERDLPQEIEIRVRDLAIFASGRKQVRAPHTRDARALCAFVPSPTLRRANIKLECVRVRKALSLSRLRLISKEWRRRLF